MFFPMTSRQRSEIDRSMAASVVFALIIILIGVLLAAGCVGWLGGKYERDQDVLISKLNPDGIVVWTKLIDTGNYDHALDFIQTSDGGFLIVGGNSRTACDNWPRNLNPEIPRLTRLSSNGNILWEQEYKREKLPTYLKTVIQNPDNRFDGVLDNGMIARFDENGNLLNLQGSGIYDSSGNFDIIQTFIQTNDGGFLLAGSTIAKLDNEGNLSWQQLHDIVIDGTDAIAEIKNNEDYLALVHDHSSLQNAILYLDKNGRISKKTFIGFLGSPSKSVLQKTNNGYTILLQDRCPLVYHLNKEGIILDNLTLINASKMTISLDDGSLISLDLPSPGHLVKETRMNPDGTIIWEKSNQCSDKGCPNLRGDVIRTSDGGFAIMTAIEKQHSC
jgi:hypothetical protein